MKEVTVNIIGTGKTFEDRYRVNLPTYRFINIDTEKRQARILVPDDEADENGKLSKDKIRQKYRGQKWDNPTVCDDVLI